MKRTPTKDPIPITTDVPDNMPECFGKLYDPRNTHCLQCTAFNMCAYVRLKHYDTNFLDMSRILNVTDEDISNFIEYSKPVSEVLQWLHKEGNTIDPIAVKLRLDRYVRDTPHVTLTDETITVL